MAEGGWPVANVKSREPNANATGPESNHDSATCSADSSRIGIVWHRHRANRQACWRFLMSPGPLCMLSHIRKKVVFRPEMRFLKNKTGYAVAPDHPGRLDLGRKTY
jgi:hypothetical protein